MEKEGSCRIYKFFSGLVCSRRGGKGGGNCGPKRQKEKVSSRVDMETRPSGKKEGRKEGKVFGRVGKEEFQCQTATNRRKKLREERGGNKYVYTVLLLNFTGTLSDLLVVGRRQRTKRKMSVFVQDKFFTKDVF